jgi:hypothetical protein
VVIHRSTIVPGLAKVTGDLDLHANLGVFYRCLRLGQRAYLERVVLARDQLC